MKVKEKTYTIKMTEDELGQVMMALFAFDIMNYKEIEEWREHFREEYEEDILPLERREFYNFYFRLLNRYLNKETD